MQKIERRFVDVDGRRVHYRRVGAGPPAVFIHASPANSEMVLAEMAAAAPFFTCFAFDTPGFGESQPLPGATLLVRDLAAATAAAMRAIGLAPCPVFGTHSGAAIAVELGARWPDQVTGLVLEGLPIFSTEEMALFFRDFFVGFPPDPLAAHFTSTWMRFRDQFTWFPWPSRDVKRLNPIDRPRPEDIQHWVMMYYRACKTYLPAYRALCQFGEGAVLAVQALQRPAVFLTGEEDMLFGHLDRLPPLKANQRIERVPHGSPHKHTLIVDSLRAMPPAPRRGSGPTDAAPHPVPATGMVGHDPAVQFIDAADGQVFVRAYGDPTNPTLLLLHDAPGTGLALETLARSLADAFYVILPDLPGVGESDAPSEDRPILAACAAAISAIADRLCLDRFAIAAIGCGCAAAAAFASLRDPRLTAIVLEGLSAADEAVASAIAPAIPLSPEGAHWLQVWLMVRDNEIYFPWFDGRVSAQRRTQGNFDAEWLHDQTFALMKSRLSYHRYPQEAWRFDARASLTAAEVAFHECPAGRLADAIRAGSLVSGGR